jgi:ferredoxin
MVDPDDSTSIGESPAEVVAAPAPPEGIESVLLAWADAVERRAAGAPSADGLPVLPAPAEGDPDDEVRGRLRRFHFDDLDDDTGLALPDDDFLPALLHPFRDPERVRHDYPLVLAPGGAAGDGSVATPLGGLLDELTRHLVPDPDEARLLRDNLPRLEHGVRAALDGRGPSADAAEVVTRAARITEDALGLPGESGTRLHDDLERLVAALPAGGTLLTLGEQTPLLLLLHVAIERAVRQRTALRAEIGALRRRLRELLRLDDSTRTGADRSRIVAGRLGAGQAFVDPEALARVVGSAGPATPIDPDRRARIDAALARFDEYLDAEDEPLVHVVHHETPPEHGDRPEIDWSVVDASAVCREGSARFERAAGRYAPLFAAMRMAGLELESAYDPPRHDRLRESFDWRSFTPTELHALPPVLVLASADRLAGAGMVDLSHLLLAGQPINVLVTVQPAANPGLGPDDDPLAGYRFELAYLGVSHREAMVSQSSAARPDHLVDGFRRGLETTRASLHVVASGLGRGGRPAPLGSWLHGGAALEGRAHPFFRYDPEAGETWARRVDFSANAQPEADWPTYTLPCTDADGERRDRTVAFTFADFALLEHCSRRHFRVVPSGFAADELIPLDEYLVLSPDEARERVPYVLAVDGDRRLHRLAITRRLTFACRDRLDYWRTLQELAGVRNEYVREALERQREELAAEFQAERDALLAAHADGLERARSEAAGDAMRRLAESLLVTDVAGLAAETLAAPPPAASSEPAPPAEASAAAEAAPEAEPETPAAEAEAEEPWIDTLLCTSCNDCLEINPRLFVYNANKQAVIGDPRAGTFDELVRGAEKCPARCIHPGAPLDPDEPGLDALIERAKPFNI